MVGQIVSVVWKRRQMNAGALLDFFVKSGSKMTLLQDLDQNLLLASSYIEPTVYRDGFHSSPHRQQALLTHWLVLVDNKIIYLYF